MGYKGRGNFSQQFQLQAGGKYDEQYVPFRKLEEWVEGAGFDKA